MIPLGILGNRRGSAAAGAYELISTTLISSDTATVSFSSLPAGYKHLQIRFAARSNRAAVTDVLYTKFNGDTGNNYAWHRLQGTGSVVESGAGTSETRISTSAFAGGTSASNIFGSGVIDILDYTASKNKTIRNLGGYHGGATLISLYSGVWLSTATVTSVDLIALGSFVSGSRFSLYGIKG